MQDDAKISGLGVLVLRVLCGSAKGTSRAAERMQDHAKISGLGVPVLRVLCGSAKGTSRAAERMKRRSEYN